LSSNFLVAFDSRPLGDVGQISLADAFTKARLEKRGQYCEEMDRRLYYYKGSQREDFEDLLRDQYPTTYEIMRPYLFLNIYRKIIDGMSMVYWDDATRTLADGSDEEQEMFDLIYDKALMDVFMKRAEEYTAMFQTAFVQWRMSEVKQHLVLDVIEPQRIEVVQGINEPMDMNACRAMVVELQSRTDTIADQENEYQRYQYWSGGNDPLDGKGLAFIFNSVTGIEPWPAEFENDEYVNPYKDPVTDRPVYPLTKLDWDVPALEFFDLGGDDLMSAVTNFDMKLTDLMYGLKMQAFSVPVLIYDVNTTEQAPQSLPFGPGLLMRMGSAGERVSDFRFETPDPKIQDILNTFVDLVELTGRIKGADPASVRLKGDSPESGISKHLDRGDAIRTRKDRLKYWRAFENEIAKKAMIIHNVWADDLGMGTFSDSAIEAGIRVDFADVRPELDPTDELALDRMKEQDGIISPVDRMQKHNPDLSREQALKALKENEAAKREARGMVSTDDLFAGIGQPDSTGQPEEGEPITGDPEEAVDPTTALNGAQVAAMVDVINQVALGTLPRSTGIQIIAASFPLSVEDAERIMGTVGTGAKVGQPEPEPEEEPEEDEDE
jgi:hypothetical protein